jgi:hypothetical protein
VIDDDAVDLVGDILEGIDDPLEMLVDLAADGELHGAGRIASEALKSSLEAGSVDLVGMALHADQPFGEFVQAARIAPDIAQQR